MARSNRKLTRQKESRAGKFWRRALVVLAGGILGLNIYRWNAAALAGNVLPMPFGTGVAVVLSGSMTPALNVNDLVLVREKKQYETGDIVVYQSGYDLIVHRIIAQEDGLITTKGDANRMPDAPVEADAVKGAVVFQVPFVGLAVKLLKLPAVSILLLIGACVLLERSFQTERRAGEEDLDAIKAEIRRLRAELDPGDKEKPDGKTR